MQPGARNGNPPGPNGNPRGAPPLGVYGVLKVIGGNDRGKQVELSKMMCTIGRGADQELVLADIAVSRRHAQIHLTQTGYKLEDLRSGNGTLVNGKRVDEQMLNDGDQIELGNTLLRFEHAVARQEAAPPQPAPMAAPPPMAYAPPTPPPMQPPPAYAPMTPAPYAPPHASSVQPVPMAPMGYGPPSAVMPVQPVQPMQGMGGMQPMGGVPMTSPAAVSSSGGGALMGPRFLQVPSQRTVAFAAVGGSLLVGLALIGFLQNRPAPTEGIGAAVDLYNRGAADFLANRYADARRSFEAARKLAPTSKEVAQYLEACTLEEQASTAVEAGKKALGTRSYAVALEEFKKVPQGSTQYEYAQGQARDARREATSALLIEARNLSLTDAKQAMAKIEEGLAISPEHPGLKALKESVRGGNTVAALPKDNPPPPPPVREPKEPKQPKIKKQPKEVKVAAQPTPPPAGGAGDLKSVGPALSAYKARNFGGALNAMQNFVKVNTGPAQAKARAVVKDIEELKGLIDKGTPDALTKAQALDRRISGGELAAFLADKLKGAGKAAPAGTPPKGGTPPVAQPTGPKPVPFVKPGGAPAGGAPADPARDAKAEGMLTQARGLAQKDPSKARLLCRQVIQLYGKNVSHPTPVAANRLLNSIRGKDDDED